MTLKRTQIVRSSVPLKRSKPKAKRGTSTAALKRDALKAWGAYIHARDQVCQYCGKADGKLDAHHIMIRSFAATATDEGNGVLLDFQHHQLMHSDPMKAVIFYTKLLGQEGYEALRLKAYNGKDQRYPASFWKAECERLSGLLAGINQ